MDLERGNYPQFRAYCMQNYYTDVNFTKHLAKPPKRTRRPGALHEDLRQSTVMGGPALDPVPDEASDRHQGEFNTSTMHAWSSTTVPTCCIAPIMLVARRIRTVCALQLLPGIVKAAGFFRLVLEGRNPFWLGSSKTLTGFAPPDQAGQLYIPYIPTRSTQAETGVPATVASTLEKPWARSPSGRTSRFRVFGVLVEAFSGLDAELAGVDVSV